MLDWSVEYQHKPTQDAYAKTWTDNEARTAVIVLATSLPKNPSDRELDRIAFHEISHLVFNDLTNEAKARYTVEYDIDRAEHAIIRRLENVIFGVERK